MIRHPGVTGAILAGGLASRLGGAEKPLLELTGPEDTPLSRLLAVFSGRFPRTLIVTTRPGLYAGFAAQPVADAVAGRGPLGGLEAALSAAATPFVFLCGGDMPFVSGPLIDAMAGRAAPGRILALERHGRPEPLHALYPIEALAAVRSALDGGLRMMLDLYSLVPADLLPASAYQGLPGAGRSFENINTPEDLDRARRLAGAPAPP
ncbi:MAG TPA: molybdenum cofactor guanylyltransferase [Candidatus Polarisedimenticolia bacterium]|nr:molybdenum cofactor guanylyltransferase [Candidatus Polarisedimenticolia bacterium]